VILASNLKQNMDEAFLRRIQFVVEFPAPNEKARRRIYEITFPPTVAPPEPADLDEVAGRFRLTGGSIKNIVVEATFRALAEGCLAADGRPQIKLHHLVLATAREYQKLGKPLMTSEFGPDFYRWVEADILLGNGSVKTT
jgi:SpoVK/Ycf46/Vps4 family AAA+-type ATPase